VVFVFQNNRVEWEKNDAKMLILVQSLLKLLLIILNILTHTA
jgi:hypothetical protein